MNILQDDEIYSYINLNISTQLLNVIQKSTKVFNKEQKKEERL